MVNQAASPRASGRKRILTWHIHGNYLYYLTQVKNHDFYLPVKEGSAEGYGGRAGTLPWGENVFDIPAEDVRNTPFDAVIYQSHRNYLEDRLAILSEDQRQHVPQVYLEHDPPLKHPTDTKHPVDDPNMVIVHVTHFNNLMWDNNRTPSVVIEHGVVVPEGVEYAGELDRGITVVNNINRRGRRTGPDVYRYVRERVPVDLVGMNYQDMEGGIGEWDYSELLQFESRYRFFFNPIRYTSLGLAVCEAMMIGMPIIGLATTEMSTAIQNGENGYIDTNLDRLVDCMNDLLHNPAQARRLSEGARRTAQERFHIQRFARDWDNLLRQL